MSDRYPGGVIRDTPPTITPPVDGEGGSAPGVWTLEQASYYTEQGSWPQKVLPRTLYAWGRGANGGLGQNDVISYSSPVQIAGTDWSQISFGRDMMAAIKSDGSLWSWGKNDAGQLGQNDIYARSSPVQVGSLTNWSKISAGVNHVLAIKTDGTLWGWGTNSNGQVGDGTTIDKSSPVQIGSDTTWLQINITSAYTSSAIKSPGTLWSWGNNYLGQLGINNRNNQSSPTQVGSLTTWAYANSGMYSTNGAIKTDGTLWTWGRNPYGQIGDGTTTYRSSPVQVGALTTWQDLKCAYDWTLALKTDNSVWAWGRNNYGQFADGTSNPSAQVSPVQAGGGSTDWSKIQVASREFYGIKADGTLWSAGEGNEGPLGQGDEVSRSTATQVGLETNWDSISGGLRQVAAIQKG